MRRRASKSFACVVLAVLVPALAIAQPTASQTLTGQAAEDYARARLLYDAGDFVGASEKFQRAFDTSGDARLLWNIAACEKNLRHYVTVLRLLERYSKTPAAGSSLEHREEVNDALDAVRKLVSTLQLRVDQPDVAIEVDGTRAGTTPLAQPLLVDSGRRRIVLRKTGFEDHVIDQDFAGGSHAVFEILMERVDSRGRLRVVAPPGASIRIDDNVVGLGEWQGLLPDGEHSLRVSAEGKRDYTKDVSVVSFEERTLYVSLQAAESGVPAWVWIGAGAVVTGGLATAGYFLFRGPEHATAVPGSLDSVEINGEHAN